MRVLFDSKAFERPGGGIYEYGVQLLQGLAAKGEVELFVQIEPNRLPSVLQGKVTALGNYRFRGWRGMGLEGWYAERLCRKHQIDLYHSLYYIPKPKTRIPSVATCYDFIWERYPEQFTVARLGVPKLKKKTLRTADRVLCISEATARDCKTFLDRVEGISTIHLGMDNRFETETKSSGEEVLDRHQLTRPYFLYTGPRYGYKNFARLFAAFEKVGLQDRFDLVCLGHHDHITSHERHEWAKGEQKVPSYLRLLGFVSEQDRISIFQEAFALSYPSEYEGFGIPLLEAMAAGVPVVCGNQSSLPEVGGDAVEYVDPFDVDDIARGLQTVSEQSLAEREKMIQKGKERAAKFSWQRCAEETFSVYQEILESGNRK